jgi:acyl carrier protein
MARDIRERVEALIARVLGETLPATSAAGDSLLGEAGGFDSTRTLELIVEVEREFAIVIQDDEISPANLGTTENLISFIRSKKA